MSSFEKWWLDYQHTPQYHYEHHDIEDMLKEAYREGRESQDRRIAALRGVITKLKKENRP